MSVEEKLSKLYAETAWSNQMQVPKPHPSTVADADTSEACMIDIVCVASSTTSQQV